jgi:hypothetical protein
MIIGLAGFAGSGKDTVAKILMEEWNYKRFAFADKIKEVLYDVNPIVTENLRVKDLVDKHGWDVAKTEYIEIRQLLQDLGSSGRNHFGKLHWAHQVFKELNLLSKAVITDVRFWNEADQTRLCEFAQVWRVHRPGTGPVNNHESEIELIDYEYDAVIINDSDIPSLREKVNTEILRAIKNIPNMEPDAFKTL